MALELPFTNESSSYQFQIALENRVFFLEIYFVTRMNQWAFDLLTETQQPILYGLPIQSGFPLLFGYNIPNLPLGDIIAIDQKEQNRDADRDSLGRDIKVVYLESDEV
jgi:hypothetical protein